jgi:hypothetical protein
MTCVSESLLRAKLDGELSQAELLEVNRHLASCAECRRRAEAVRLQAERVTGALAALAPQPSETPVNAGIAFARFRAEHAVGEEEGRSVLSRLFSKHLRPAWGALALASLVVAFVSFAPARSWAQKILAMLRVQKIAVVAVDPRILSGRGGDNRPGEMLEHLISDNLVVTMNPGEPQPVASAEQASQMTGYRVRLLSNRSDSPQLKVEGESAFHMTINRERLQGILDEAGRSDLELPASLDGATIAVHIPKLVVAAYGNCPDREKGKAAQPGNRDRSSCMMLAEVPSPTVSVPPDLNISQIAEAGLQLAGMSAGDAQAFCQTVDWTSTLVLPIPRDVTSYQTVDVDGVQGTLISIPGWGTHEQPGYDLVWVKNGIIYSLNGHGNAAEAVPLADSLN